MLVLADGISSDFSSSARATRRVAPRYAATDAFEGTMRRWITWSARLLTAGILVLILSNAVVHGGRSAWLSVAIVAALLLIAIYPDIR